MGVDLHLWMGDRDRCFPNGAHHEANGDICDRRRFIYLSGLFKKIVHRFRDTSSELSEDRFVGLNGAVVSTVIPRFSDGRVGQLNVTDKTGVSGVAAVIPDWAEESPRANDRVQLIDYDPARKLFIVVKPDSDDYLRWISARDSAG